jgi:hypothetical protein
MGSPCLLGESTVLGELRGSSQIPQLRMLPPVHLGKTSGLVHPVKPLDNCVPLQISIGSVPLSLFIREEALLEPAIRRYREFTHDSENGFPIVLKQSGVVLKKPEIVLKKPEAQTQENGEFSFLLDDARLILRSKGAEFHGVRHEYALDSLLRILLTMVLLPQRGFLLHGATVVRDGRAYIFFGRSGAGKSTVASLSPKGSVLTDEISLLRFSNGCWQAHGTPFWGEFRAAGQNRLVPVAGLYLLKQANEERVETLDARQALRALLPCVLFFASKKHEHETLLRTLLGMVEQIPCHRLHFRRNAEFWRVVAA